MEQHRRQKDRNRHSMRVDLTERDYDYLRDLLDQGAVQGWSLNYLVQVIVNRWVSLHAAGHDIGVLSPGSDTALPTQQQE